MTRVMRECERPEIRHEELAPGHTRLTTLRVIDDALTHVRVTNALFPHTFVIPLSETLTITQMHVPVNGRHNDWRFDPAEQRTRTYLGMGEEDINLHDQWAVESMGAIQDRTREHLGTSDKVIMAHRRQLLKAIETVRAGGTPPLALAADAAAAMVGPDTIDCIAPATRWQDFWQEAAAAKRAAAPWLQRAAAGAAAA